MGTDNAIRRLAMLAGLFARPSRTFLTALRGEEPELALDLGCGAGHSTRLVASALRPRRTVGLDSSAPALAAARARTRHPGVSFVEHDVTASLPLAPDLIYSRFLLAHVPEPEQLVRRWVGGLRPGGKLLLDEGTSVTTAHEPIGRYLEMVGALLEHRGTSVDVGGLLDRLSRAPGVERTFVRETTFAPPANKVAAMLLANIDTFRHDPFITTVVGGRFLAWLEHELGDLAASPVREGVGWGLTQVALAPCR